MLNLKTYFQNLSSRKIFFNGMGLGIVVSSCIIAPDISSAFASWIGAIGGIVVLLWAVYEFTYTRQPHIKVEIDFPYTTAFYDRGELMPLTFDRDYLTGSIINYGDKKVVLVDGGIRSTTKEYFDMGKKFHPERQGAPWRGTTLDGSNFGGNPLSYPLELNAGDVKKYKINRVENLDRDFLFTKDVEYFVVWVKDASENVFYKVLQTPYYHDEINLQDKRIQEKSSDN